jgi:hypothetical protein
MRIHALMLALGLIARHAEAGPLSCADVESDHKASEDATKTAFQAALAAKQLTLVSLERHDIGGFPTQEKATSAVREATASWKQFTYKVAGHKREAIASEAYRSDGVQGVPPELVKDAHGDIWRVQRKPTPKVTKTVSVKACQWGCWGFAGSGVNRPMEFTRDVWLLPEKATYRGDIQIEFVAPTLVVNYVPMPQPCASPP